VLIQHPLQLILRSHLVISVTLDEVVFPPFQLSCTVCPYVTRISVSVVCWSPFSSEHCSLCGGVGVEL